MYYLHRVSCKYCLPTTLVSIHTGGACFAVLLFLFCEEIQEAWLLAKLIFGAMLSLHLQDGELCLTD